MGDTRRWTSRDVLLLLFVIVVVEGIFPREIVMVGGFLRIFFFFLCIQICVLSPPLVHFTLFFFSEFWNFFFINENCFFLYYYVAFHSYYVSFHFSNSFFDTLHKVIYLLLWIYIFLFYPHFTNFILLDFIYCLIRINCFSH